MYLVLSPFLILPPPWYLLSGVLEWRCFLWVFKCSSIFEVSFKVSETMPIVGESTRLTSVIFQYSTDLGRQSVDNCGRMGWVRLGGFSLLTVLLPNCAEVRLFLNSNSWLNWEDQKGAALLQLWRRTARHRPLYFQILPSTQLSNPKRN